MYFGALWRACAHFTRQNDWYARRDSSALRASENDETLFAYPMILVIQSTSRDPQHSHEARVVLPMCPHELHAVDLDRKSVV